MYGREGAEETNLMSGRGRRRSDKVGDKKVENKKREKWKNKIIISIPLKQKERKMEK